MGEVRRFSNTSVLEVCTTIGLEMTLRRESGYQAPRGMVSQSAVGFARRGQGNRLFRISCLHRNLSG